MIEIADKRKCTGCGACQNACMFNAISMREDDDGFLYPHVDKNKCINCHLCEKVCPFYKESLVRRSFVSYPQFIAAQIKNKTVLTEVSSGGVSWALAELVISKGGVVYGAVQNNVDDIYHCRLESLESAKNIRRSKYFQSKTHLCFRQVKADLKNNRLVLYTGVPCQIAGLLCFLGENYENLITAEVVCHGVPSNLVWRRYKEEVEKKHNSKITSLVFRDKSKSWKMNQYKMSFSSGQVVYERSSVHPFHRGYLLGLFSRPSCGACVFSTLPRVADFTFADYWKYDGDLFSKSLNLGVSLIALNSTKASKYFDELTKYIDFEEVDKYKALDSCRHMNKTPLENPKRNAFIRYIKHNSFDNAWKKFIREKISLLRSIKRKFMKG